MAKNLRWIGFAGLLLVLLVLAVPALAQDGTLIAYGDRVSGEITAAAPEVRYTFEGTEGDLITARMEATVQGLDSYLVLVGPDGAELLMDDDGAGNLNSLIGPYRLPASGSYTLIATRFQRLDGTSTGTYELSLALAEVNPLSFNETLTIELDDTTPSQFFQFTGKAGDMFSLVGQGQGGSADYRIDVRDFNGTYVNNMYGVAQGEASIDPLILPADGDYIVMVSRQAQGGALVSSGTAVRIALTLRPIESTPLTLGTAVEGTLDDAAPAAHFSFSATAGDLLRLEGQQGESGIAFETMLFGPEGYQINGSSTGYDGTGSFMIDPLVIDTTGPYTLVVRRFDTTGQGVVGAASSYSIVLSETQTPALVAGQETTGTFEAVSQYEQVFRYVGTAGQSVRLTLRSVDEMYGPSLDVQGPTATSGGAVTSARMGGGGGGGYIPFVFNVNSGLPSTVTYTFDVPADGTYLFRVRNGISSPDGTPAGSFGLLVEIVE